MERNSECNVQHPAKIKIQNQRMFLLAENRKITSSECNGAFPATRKGKVERNKKKKRGGGGEWTNIFLVILLNI